MIRQIRIDELEIGMVIARVDRKWLDIPFFRKTIQTSDQIRRLREFDVKVLYIDTEKGSDVKGKEGPHPWGRPRPKGTSTPKNGESGEVAQTAPGIFKREEVNLCEALQRQALQCVRGIFQSVESGNSVNLAGARETIEDILGSMVKYPNVITTLSKLKAFDDYTFAHSVNVAIFSMTLGEALRCPLQDVKDLGLGALLHDIGKTQISNAILNKAGPLDPGEFAEMRKHPVEGMDLVKNDPAMSPGVLCVLLEHHERLSGSGYPRGLRGKSISEFAMIASIADIYDAMTSERVYQKKVSPHATIARMFELAKGDLNPDFVEKFITRIGVYPVGSVVVLTSGELGVVTAFRSDSLLYPEILLVRDREGRDIRPVDKVNLRHDRRRRRISGVKVPEEVGICLGDLLLDGE